MRTIRLTARRKSGLARAALLALLAALLAAPGAADANDNSLWQNSTLKQILTRGELRVGLEPGYVPFEMLDDKQQVIGFDVDVAREMAQAMGVKLRIVQLDWNGILPALLADQFDIIMSGMTITPERNLWVNFADSYMTVGQTILLRKALADKVESYKDLDDKAFTVVTKPGTTAQEAVKKFMPNARMQLFESEAAAVNEVTAGRADAFVYDLPFNAIYYARNKDKLVFLDTPFTHERLGWGVRKGDPDFLNWLNNFLAQMKGDGRYAEIYERWFKDGAWLGKTK